MSLTLDTALASIAAALALELAPITVEPHGGQFTENELAMLLGKAPCVLIAALSLADIAPAEAADQYQARVTFGAYCIGSDAKGDRAEMAMTLTQALLDQLHSQAWGWDDADYEPLDYATVRADNLYSGHINNLRVAVWAVTWAQTLIFTMED